MKTPALQKLRQKLAADQPVYGLWITLESASITEMAVALGLDWVVIDAEHGHLDWRDILEHIRATVRSDTVALVRVAELSAALVKRALDIGADGIVVPWIESADQLLQAVAFAHYPPRGVRGIGGERATGWGQCTAEHVAQADQNVLVVPIIESVKGGQNIDSLLTVDGVDVFFFGSADYSSTAGYAGQWEGPGVAEQILVAREAIRKAGKHCGVLCTDNNNVNQRREQGFWMLGLGSDTGMILRRLGRSLDSVGLNQKIHPTLTPQDAASPAPPTPLARPPEPLRPDRPPIITAVGEGPAIELAQGVTMACLVGPHNNARNLTTGIVTMQPGANLPCQRNTYSESFTLLEGQVTVEVEGRRYSLNQLDNITVPRGIAHSVINADRSLPAELHCAMATANPAGEPVDRFFSRRMMPDESISQPGAERVTRLDPAAKPQPGQQAMLIDHFNDELMPGIEMSGGYGLFYTGQRLLAHAHDFDESICIIQGQATCLVEGKPHYLFNCATALVPRGRVHYFMNEHQDPMAMLWIYAGPMPERIVIEERCAADPDAGGCWD